MRTLAQAGRGERRILLAAPRGFCAGVVRAVAAVERALDLFGAPVYVRRQIVHNRRVVERLERRGAVFVEEIDDIPGGAPVVLSAHGVAPSVRDAAARRGLRVIDATCPLVTKVHMEARRFADDGYDIVLVGSHGHDETIGTAGEAPGRTQVVDGPGDVPAVTARDPARIVWLSQTTLTVEETLATVDKLRERFPLLTDPPSDDICDTWLEDVVTIGVTAGASAPEVLVDGVLQWLGARGFTHIEEIHTVHEGQTFALPQELRGPRVASVIR